MTRSGGSLAKVRTDLCIPVIEVPSLVASTDGAEGHSIYSETSRMATQDLVHVSHMAGRRSVLMSPALAAPFLLRSDLLPFPCPGHSFSATLGLCLPCLHF